MKVGCYGYIVKKKIDEDKVWKEFKNACMNMWLVVKK